MKDEYVRARHQILDLNLLIARLPCRESAVRAAVRFGPALDGDLTTFSRAATSLVRLLISTTRGLKPSAMESDA
jgi:hypothetical protein